MAQDAEPFRFTFVDFYVRKRNKAITQFYRIKGGGGSERPLPPTDNF